MHSLFILVLNEIFHLTDLVVEEGIILKWTLKKKEMTIGLIVRWEAVARSYERGNKFLVSKKGREVPDQPCNMFPAIFLLIS